MFDEAFFGEVEGAFFAVVADGEFGGVAAAVARAPGGLPVFVFVAGGGLGDDVGDSFDAAFFDVTASAGEGVEAVFGEFFDQGVAVTPGFGEGGGFAVVGFVGEELGIDFSLEGDAHEPPVVAFFGLVDAADAVVGPGKFHAWGVGTVRRKRPAQVLIGRWGKHGEGDWRGQGAGARVGPYQ